MKRTLTESLWLFLGIWTFVVFGLNSPEAKESRPTEPFRAEHQEIRKQLTELDHLNALLGSQPHPEQQKSMKVILDFFTQHIQPHAKWEEKVLYPSIDRRAGKGENPFTAIARHEHRILERWMKELTGVRENATEFSRRVNRILGLLDAHFEVEEEVLLPVLDRGMSPVEFRREIGTGHSTKSK